MAFSSVLQMYLGWANSIMCERGVLIEGLDELRDGAIFCHLIELLTDTDLGVGNRGDGEDQKSLNATVQVALDYLQGIGVKVKATAASKLANDSVKPKSLNATVQVALDYLQGIGVKVKATAASVVCGELKSILDMLWSIILHCTIHSPDHPVNQRTVRNGRKTLLQWCGMELGDRSTFDMNTTMVKSFYGNNLLSDLINVHSSFSNDEADNDDELVTNLTNAILAAEDHLGISNSLLNPADVITGIADEHALLIYVALFRRKVSILMSRTSSLSSLSSNDSFAFNIPTNSRYEIMEALQKAHSFRFVRSRRKSDLRKFVLGLTALKLKHYQKGLAKARKSSTSSIPDSIVSSESLPTSQASDVTISAPSDHIHEFRETVSSTSNHIYQAEKTVSASANNFQKREGTISSSAKTEKTVAASANNFQKREGTISSSANSSHKSIGTISSSANSSHKSIGTISASSKHSQKYEETISAPPNSFHKSEKIVSASSNNFHTSEKTVLASSSYYSKSEEAVFASSNNFQEEESGVDSSEIQSVSHMVSSWNEIISPSPATSPYAIQSFDHSAASNDPQGNFQRQNSVDSNQMSQQSQRSQQGQRSQQDQRLHQDQRSQHDQRSQQSQRSQQDQRSQQNQRSQQGQQTIHSHASQRQSEDDQRMNSYNYQQNSYVAGGQQGQISNTVQRSKNGHGGGDAHRVQRSEAGYGGGDAYRVQRSETGHGGRDARSAQRSEVRYGGGDANRDRYQQGNRNVELPQYERQPTPSGKGGLPKAEDELLNILEAISLESSNLRQELNESQQRETSLKEELNKSQSAAEDHVVSKLVQELEMLRAENHRLFKDSASARTSNAHDKRTSDKLQTTINRLKNDVDQLNSDNFRLKLRLKLLESHKVQDGQEGADGVDTEKRGQEFLMDQFMDFPQGSSSEDLMQHLSSNQQLLGNFSDVNVQLAGKLSELNDDLTAVKVSSRRVEQENRLLRMSAETSKMEVEVIGSKCRRLEDHLSLAQKKNAKLVQDLHGIARESSPDSDKTHTFLRMRQSEEENTLLKQRLELADEDRLLLKRKLEQYTKHQSLIDAMFRDGAKTSPRDEDDEKQSIARERVMQSVRGKDERDANQNQPLTNGQDHRLDFNRNENRLDENLLHSETRNKTDHVSRRDNIETVKQKKSGYLAAPQGHIRKPSLGDLIVEIATSPPKEGVESQEQDAPYARQNDAQYTIQSDMSEAEDNTPPGATYEYVTSNKESLQMAQQDETTDDDIDSQTTEELSLGQLQENYDIKSTDWNTKIKESKFTTINSSMTKLRVIAERSRTDFAVDGSGDAALPDDRSKHVRKDVLLQSTHNETSNPRLLKLQRLRKSLGIEKPGQNLPSHSSEPQGGYQKEAPDFEIKSRIGTSGRGRIAKWNKFNSYKEDNDDDLGSSYLEPSANRPSTRPRQADIVQEETPTRKTFMTEPNPGFEDSQFSQPEFGSITLDEYVQSLKHRVKTLETETEEFDEYIKLPEHFAEPQRLAERSPKRDSVKGSPEERVPAAKSSVVTEEVVSSQKLTSKEGKRGEILRMRRSLEQKEGVRSTTPFSSRVSGDGMSDCHGQLADFITDDDVMNLDEITQSEDDIKPPSQSNQSNPPKVVISISSNRTKQSSAKRTSSSSKTIPPSQDQSEDADRMVQKILSQTQEHVEEADCMVQTILSQSMTSSGGTEKLHLSNSEESKSYKHQLLKTEEQEYANSIIEKYLEQLSVTPQ